MWIAIVGVVAGLVTIGAGEEKQPELDFQQAGHWVYSNDGKSLFHVDGGTRSVDARTSEVDLSSDHTVVQGDDTVLAAVDGEVVVFGKSTLAVRDRIDIGLDETPVGLEVVGGPYLVYRQAGTVARFSTVPPTIVEFGGPLGEPAVTSDGTVWAQREDSAALCRLERESTTVSCPFTAPGERRGAVAAVADTAVFLDPASGTMTTVDGDGLGVTTAVGTRLSSKGQTATVATGGRLAAIDSQTHRLVLFDVRFVADGGTPAKPISVRLPDGNYLGPVPTDKAVVVIDRRAHRLLTFDLRGQRRSSVELPEGTGTPRVARGEDGRVYVDSEVGSHTMVVDRDGSVTLVPVDKEDVASPTQDRTPPPAPVTTAPPAPPPPGRTDKPATPPGPPPAVTGQPGNAEAILAWGPASPNGAAITEYRLAWTATDGEGTDGEQALGATELSARVTGLKNGTTYVFRVSARNAAGVGPAAESAPIRPSSDVPGTPSDVAATAADDGSVAVTWQAADAEGRRIREYTVVANGEDGGSVAVGSANGTSIVVADKLTLGIGYTFVVTASNDLGLSGRASEPGNQVTPYRPSGPPTAAQAAGSDQAVSLTWAEPELNGGELVDYEISVNGVATQTATEGAATITGLTNGTPYTFDIVARTRERGKSGPTVNGEPAQIVGTPGRTAEVDVTNPRLSGDRQITVTVNVRDYSSGGVTCHIFFNGGERWTGGCASGQDITVGGLDYSTTYSISASGSNGFGTGSTGSAATARTNDPPPPPPTVEISKGPRKNISTCNTSACALINVTLRNFAPNANFAVSCQTNYPAPQGEYYRYNAGTDGAGASNTATCVYGHSNRQVWVIVNGVRSNTLTW